jgi:hypothetical protein
MCWGYDMANANSVGLDFEAHVNRCARGPGLLGLALGAPTSQRPAACHALPSAAAMAAAAPPSLPLPLSPPLHP